MDEVASDVLVTRDPAPPVSWTLFLLVSHVGCTKLKAGRTGQYCQRSRVHAADSEGGKSESTNQGLVMLHEKKKRKQKQKQRVLQRPVTLSSSVVDDDDDDVWR